MEHIDDTAAVIQRAAAGEAAAFRVLYEHLIDKVYNYVQYRTASTDDALDLTQEVFIDLFKALPNFTYSSEAEWYGFVFAITKRKLARRYAEIAVEQIHTTRAPDEAVLGAAKESDLGTVDAVKRALTTLDDTARDIIVLHHWSRYTFGEIASLIHMTESAVRVRHHRALKTLSVTLGTQ
jgi:RNA polymerase sigma factor (sigma-70 family)